MALKRQPIAPYTVLGGWGLTNSKEEAKAGGWGPGGGSLPAKAPHPAPPSREARRPRIPRGPSSSQGV